MTLHPHRLAELLDVLRNKQSTLGLALDEIQDVQVQADARDAWRATCRVLDQLSAYLPEHSVTSNGTGR